MGVNYEYYKIFCFVARYRSFTRAAEALCNNQPNITRCMNNLERELGCRLFVRSNRGVTLTPEGERLYVRAAAAMEQLEAGEAELELERGLERGFISIGASEIALRLLLLDRLGKFHRSYPGVRLKISNHSTPQAVAALKSGLTDCAVVTGPAGAAKPLRETRLLAFQEILICGPGARHLAKRPRRLEELESLSFVCLGEGTGTYEFYRGLFLERGRPFRVDIEAATTDQVLPMVQHDLGIGFYPERLAAPALARGEVFQIPLAEPVPPRSVCLIEDTARPRSAAFQRLREMLCDGGGESFS